MASVYRNKTKNRSMTASAAAAANNNNNTINVDKIPTQSEIKKNDEIENEYNYYVILTRQLVLFMSDEERKKIARWIHLLVHPLNSAQPLEIREKRNQYLFIMCCGLLTGNVNTFLKITRSKHLKADQPKKSKFAKVAGMKGSMAPLKPTIADEHGFPHALVSALNPLKLTTIDDVFNRAEWQNVRFWERRLQNAKDAEAAIMKLSKHRTTKKDGDKKKCSIHDECPKDLVDSKVGKCLDRQFEYLLALAETYKDLLRSDANKMNRINLWLQALAKIDPTYCAHMKGIRNDYAMMLAGYLVNGEIKGPFEDLPPVNIQPLTQAIATYITNRKIESNDKSKVPLNPASDTIEAFMNSVPTIEEGAFALLSLSGNLFSSPQHRI